MSRISQGLGHDPEVIVKTAAGTTDLGASPDSQDIVVLLNAAYTAAAAVTLPKASGTGRRVRVLNAAVQTQNITIAVRSAADVLAGVAASEVSTAVATASMLSFLATATDDTMIWKATDGTTGGKGGDTFEAVDVAEGKWFVQVKSFTTGVSATPFSAAV